MKENIGPVLPIESLNGDKQIAGVQGTETLYY